MSKHVIVDLEMCGVSKELRRDTFRFRSELIQIGAVIVDESLKITDEFMTYVSPQYGVINAYIEQLTGITQNDVKDAPCFEEALKMFLQWLPDDAVLVSWSENDKHQIKKEAEAKAFVDEALEKYLENWIDCQRTFGEKMDADKNYKLSEALIIANIDYSDGEHDALVDAKNTAQLFIKMEKEPELVLNPYYSTKPQETTYNPFASLLSNYKAG